MRVRLLLWMLLTGAVFGQAFPGTVRYVLIAPAGSCIAGATSPLTQLITGAGTVYACQSITASVGTWTALASGSATGTVTTLSVVTANGISGSVANATTTPAITLTLGAITPTSVNGVSAATMAFVDPTSSIQTQLNGKAASTAAITIGGTSVALGGSTSSFPTPGAIGGATPSTGKFTTMTLTTLADGCLNIATNLVGTTGLPCPTGTVTSITQGTGMSFSVSPCVGTCTINLGNTAVTPGSYTLSSVTVDQQGRITAISSGSAGSGTLTSVTANGTTNQITITGSSPCTVTCSLTWAIPTNPVLNGTVNATTGFSGGTPPTITTPGTGSLMLMSEGTQPASFTAGFSGWVADSTSHCPIQYDNSANVGCAAALGATGTWTATQTMTGKIIYSGHDVAIPLACADVSGSGTVQSCTTSPSYTPATGDCVIYRTTTPNSGTGLTLNVNALGARSVAIAGSSGWTTTLTASIIPANKPTLTCYDGTNWNDSQTGTSASGTVVTSLTGTGVITNSVSTGAVNLTVAGTSGGGIVFTSASTWASTGLLCTNCLMAGGGAGVAYGTGNGDFTYATHTLTAAAAGLIDFSAPTAASSVKLPAGVGGTLAGGTVTANLSAPTVLINTNSSNNNTSLGAIIGAAGTSTGGIGLVVFDASGTGDIQRWYTGGSVASGVYTVGTLEGHIDNSGNATFAGSVATGTAPTCTAGTSGATCYGEGTAVTGAANVDTIDANSTSHALAVNNNNTGEMPISRAACVNVTPVTVAANVTSDQLLQACSFNANLLNVVGRTLKVYVAGVFSTAAASTASLTFKAKLCTVSGCGSGTVISPVTTATGATAALTASNLSFSQTSYIVTQTAGASSAYEAHGFLTIDLSATAATPDSTYQDTNTATVGTIDNTGALFLQITVAASAGSTSNSFTERELIVEVVN